MTNRIKIFLFIIPIVLLIMFVSGCEDRKYIVTTSIINKSDSVIKTANITVYGKTYTVNNFKSGEVFKFSYTPGADEHYAVEWIDSKGIVHNKNIGYITNGMNLEDSIEIYPEKLKFQPVTFKD